MSWDPFHKKYMISELKYCGVLFALIMILIIQSGYKFAHVATAELLQHVQNCGLIWSVFLCFGTQMVTLFLCKGNTNFLKFWIMSS